MLGFLLLLPSALVSEAASLTCSEMLWDALGAFCGSLACTQARVRVCSARREGKSAQSGALRHSRTWSEMGLAVFNPRRALQPGVFPDSLIFLPGVPAASHPALVPGFLPPATRPQCRKKGDAGEGCWLSGLRVCCAVITRSVSEECVQRSWVLAGAPPAPVPPAESLLGQSSRGQSHLL